jgi:uncharacterized membrane protein
VGLVVNVALLLLTAVLFSRLPEQVPTHWDMSGAVNGTMPRFPGAFLASGLGVVLWFALPVLRRLDPRRAAYERFEGTFYIVVNTIALVLALVQGLTLAYMLGVQLDMVRSLLFGVGIMLIVIGNYMPRLQANWWMGIRTPWTLESDEVWRRTHRFGGRMFFAAGIVTVLATPLPTEAASLVSIAAIVVAAVVPAVYSYVVWRSERSSPGL